MNASSGKRVRRTNTCKVVILAGGEGVRLRPLTFTRPKSLIPLGRKPVIEHLITQLSRSGFTDFVLTVNYLKEQIMYYIGSGSRFNIKVEYAVEPEGIFLGTAGGVKLAGHSLNNTFLVIQGDAYTDIDLKKALSFHRQYKADATIILKESPEPWLYGSVVRDADGKITEFQEKPQRGEAKSNLVSTGIYCLEPDVLDFIVHGECDFAKNVFPRLLSEEKRVLGFVAEGFWVDVGNLRGYLEGTRQVLETPPRNSGSSQFHVSIGKNVAIDATVNVKDPVLIEDRVSIAKNCQIGPYAVLKEGVKVGAGSTVENAVIFEGADLGSLCKIGGSILGEWASLADRVTVDGSVIGPGSILEESVQIRNGSRVWPGIRVNSNTSVEGTLTLPTDRPFFFHTDVCKYIGVTASTISEMADILEKVDITAIEFHLYRRDFERWIRDVFHANILAERIAALREDYLRGEYLRGQMVSLVREWIERSTEHDRWR